MNGDYVMHAESMVNSDISYCFFESSNSVILELAKNDVVDLGNCTDVYTLVSGTQTSFSGYLIQEEEAAN